MTNPIHTPGSSTEHATLDSWQAIIRATTSVLAPPERLNVPEAAAKYRYIENVGAYTGPWINDTVPYMVEPAETFTSRVIDKMAFCGPAQCAKTDALVVNTILFSVKVDPMDMIVYCPSNAAARDFSTRRIDRLHRQSKEVGAMLMKEKDSDNKFDKHYTTGMILSLSWPSVTELAGRPIGRVVITDYDRIEDDIGGDGNAFDLANKRTTSFRSFAMTCAESSPSRQITDPRWIKSTPHEAPPTTGILALYNRGDRRRWHWPCPNCGSYFEGNFRLLTWDRENPNKMEASNTVRMICPSCDHHIHPDHRYAMNTRGKWVKDGQRVEKDGTIVGPEVTTDFASFWLNGTAAAFVSWMQLVRTFMTADGEFQRTGSEEALSKFYNTDLGEPYMPKGLEVLRSAEDLQSRAEAIGGSEIEPTVPPGVRFLVATVDVQQNMFIVQVHGIAPGEPFDMVYVDRFSLRMSDGSISSKQVPGIREPRYDGDGQIAWLKPGTYEDDWELLIDRVLLASYPLGDGSGRRMQVKSVGCDSGGKAGVTANAYEFYRKLRKKGLANRFQLVKGDPLPNAQRVRQTYPDSNDRGNKAAAQGDVPVLMLASNTLKDMLSNRLDSMVSGRGMHRFPAWLPDWFYVELTSENRTDKGWVKPKHARNESWDLSYYCIGICLSGFIKIESIDWEKPPAWAETWDKNNLISEAGAKEQRFAQPSARKYDFAALGRDLA